MLKTIKTLSFAAVIGTMGTFAAQAAVFDFAAIADSPVGEGTWDAQVGPAGLTDAGITVLAGAAVADGSQPAWAYLDGGNAGLGVCSANITGAAQCDPAADDNVGINAGGGSVEQLNLNFSEEVTLFSLILRDSGHNLLAAGTSIVITNIADSFTANFTVGVSDLLDWGSSTDWTFQLNANLDPEFYISKIHVSPVPLPAGGLMLLAALGGLTAARRRRKAA